MNSLTHICIQLMKKTIQEYRHKVITIDLMKHRLKAINKWRKEREEEYKELFGEPYWEEL